MSEPADHQMTGQRERLLSELGELVTQPLDVDVTLPIRRMLRDRLSTPGVREAVVGARRRPRPQLVSVSGGAA